MGMIRFFLNLMLNECKEIVIGGISFKLNNFLVKKSFMRKLMEVIQFLL